MANLPTLPTPQKIIGNFLLVAVIIAIIFRVPQVRKIVVGQ
ncbi:MAG: hypothetical protein V1933_08030 [Candidatus Omnitrophota bacterium]